MEPRNPRHSVDWAVILGGEAPLPRIVERRRPAVPLVARLATRRRAPSVAALDRLLRDAVEFSRAVLQLERAGIFLVDAASGAMMGTWGTNERGETVDEHHVMYAFGEGDRTVFDRARRGMPWTLLEDCPMVSQEPDGARVFGRGWVACTPILGPRGPLGILFNDAAISGSSYDEAKQAGAAMLCALLGHALQPYLPVLLRAPDRRPDSQHPLVRKVTRALAADPTLTCADLADRLHLSAARLARTFKRETQVSLVDHRNQVRLSRFLARAHPPGGNLLEAALEAGFGSYAQFHRVFRARFGLSPRAYLLTRRP